MRARRANQYLRFSLLLLLGVPAGGLRAQVESLNIKPVSTTVGQRGWIVDLLHFHEKTSSGRPAVLPPRFLRGDLEFDGLPFQIHSLVRLLGLTFAQRGQVHPAQIGGIPINARFDELLVIHAAAFPEADGTEIARIRLKYPNGRRHEYPIVYGRHCRDWEFRVGYETESVSDPDTKVVWRDPDAEKIGSGSIIGPGKPGFGIRIRS
jgi:hypothetical protein